MATKKQKREAAEARGAARREAERKVGLEALERARAERERQRRKSEAEARERNGRKNRSIINAMFKETT